MSRLLTVAMFELLGYHVYYADKGAIIYQLSGKSLWKMVHFDLKEKNYSCYYSTTDQSFTVDVPLHQAITQQMKELGWVEE